MSNLIAKPDRAILTRVPHDMGEELEKLAAYNERSLAGEVRLALRRHLADTQRPTTTAKREPLLAIVGREARLD